MIDSNLQPLPADIQGLLAAERGATAPVGVEHRVLARVEQTVAAPPIPAATGAAWLKPLLAVVAALGVGGGTYALWPSGSHPTQSIAVQDAPVDARRETPVLSVSSSEPKAHAAPVAARVGDTLAAERALLDRAQTALIAGDTSEADRAVAEHLHEFPRGRLAQEREALRVMVLVRAKRPQDARRVADQFVERYPRSIHRGAVEAALDVSP